jgi:hypothetical protein
MESTGGNSDFCVCSLKNKRFVRVDCRVLLVRGDAGSGLGLSVEHTQQVVALYFECAIS